MFHPLLEDSVFNVWKWGFAGGSFSPLSLLHPIFCVKALLQITPTFPKPNTLSGHALWGTTETPRTQTWIRENRPVNPFSNSFFVACQIWLKNPNRTVIVEQVHSMHKLTVDRFKIPPDAPSLFLPDGPVEGCCFCGKHPLCSRQ